MEREDERRKEKEGYGDDKKKMQRKMQRMKDRTKKEKNGKKE